MLPGWTRRRTRTRMRTHRLPMSIDVWEGASGASRDAPRFGLKSNSVSNARKKIRKSTKKIEDFTRI